MSEAFLYRATLWAWGLLSLVTFVTLLFRVAPYGRHQAATSGPSLSPRAGWLVMEVPAVIVIAALAIPSLLRDGYAQGWLLLGLWELHYVHRGLIYPFRIRSTRGMPLYVVLMGAGFQLVNGWLNARGLTVFGPELGRVALLHPRVLAGTALFLLGFVINLDADARLLSLRREREARGDDGYTIPTGGLYRYISCPNYFGELLEWIGFAVAAGSLAALSFCVWTAANLVPRALAHHRWYREKFPDYPKDRKAIFPGLW